MQRKSVDRKDETEECPARPSPLQASGPKRWVYLGIGWFFFGLGVVGAFLPVLPTTPLMIVALWAFAKSSQRFHDWLYNHRLFGPPLQRWHEHRVISARAKMAALGAMAASLAYLIWFTATPPLFLIATGGLMLVGAGYILTKPSVVPSAAEPSRRP